MGHQIEYYSSKVTTEKNLKLFISRITDNAYDPRESGGYHGKLTIHRNEIYENYEKAVEAIKKYDSGWYSDHIVMYAFLPVCKYKSYYRCFYPFYILHERWKGCIFIY